ncbi:hypothetical protein MAR_033440, partial [Mya arenaria]
VSTATHRPPPLAHISSNDKRVKHSNRQNRIPQVVIDDVKSHIEKKCETRNDCPVKESMYRYIFNTQYNIAFNKPLKDMCDFCFQYTNMCPEEKIKLKPKYDRHMENKNLARDAKEIAKSIAESNPCEGAACSDLQQVMMLPKTCQSGIYFSRKLIIITYRFTPWAPVMHTVMFGMKL